MTSKEVLDILEKLEKEYNTVKFCYEKLTKDHNSLKKDFNELLETNNIFYNTKEKYKKAIEILKGRICIHNGYVCYDAYADIRLKDNEIEILKEVLDNV